MERDPGFPVSVGTFPAYSPRGSITPSSRARPRRFQPIALGCRLGGGGWTGGAVRRRINVIPKGVEVILPRAHPPGAARAAILFVGRPEERKGRDLPRAFGALAEYGSAASR